MDIKTIEELEGLEKSATPGPWRSGRGDMVSYAGGGDGVTSGPFKNVYAGKCEYPDVPDEVLRAYRDECVENAQLIAGLRNAAPELLRIAREHAAFVAFFREHGEALGGSLSLCLDEYDQVNSVSVGRAKARTEAADVALRALVERFGKP